MDQISALDAFRAAAREWNMPHDAIEWWLQLARPCVYLNIYASGPVAGYFGGRPALPPTIAWPAGMVHLATLDLAAIPHGWTDLDLPADGTLVFFSPTGFTPLDGRIIHVPGGAAVVEAEPPGPDCTVYDRAPLHAFPDWSLPEFPEDNPRYNQNDRPDEDEYRDIKWGMSGAGGELVLGGFGTSNSGGLGVPVNWETQMLLAEFYLMENEVGKDFETDLATVYYVIDRDDLATHRFDRVKMSSDFQG